MFPPEGGLAIHELLKMKAKGEIDTATFLRLTAAVEGAMYSAEPPYSVPVSNTTFGRNSHNSSWYVHRSVSDFCTGTP